MAGNALVDYATEHLLLAEVGGNCLHSCVFLPFGDMMTPLGFFQSQNYGDVKLKITGESGLGAIKVLVQSLRT